MGMIFCTSMSRLQNCANYNNPYHYYWNIFISDLLNSKTNINHFRIPKRMYTLTISLKNDYIDIVIFKLIKCNCIIEKIFMQLVRSCDYEMLKNLSRCNLWIKFTFYKIEIITLYDIIE